jgi:hypothetical protein
MSSLRSFMTILRRNGTRPSAERRRHDVMRDGCGLAQAEPGITRPAKASVPEWGKG